MGRSLNPVVMTLLLLVLFSCTLVTLHGQSLPQLNFRFTTPDYPGRTPEMLDIHLDEDLDHLLYGLMCKYEGNRFTVRISLSDGVTKVIDDSLGMTNRTPGAVRCMTSKTPYIVGCVHPPAFCILGNICTAQLKATCNKYQTFNRWMMTEYVDVTLDREDDDIMVIKCFTKCVSTTSVQPGNPAKNSGLSELAIILIVVGVMLAAILFVGLFIVYKIRDGLRFRNLERKRSEMVLYVK